MAKIFISLSGEGRGHATRARAIVESLRQDHEIQLFASGDGYQFLRPLYEGTDVRLQRISGLRFHYSSANRLHFTRTGVEAAKFLKRLPLLTRMLIRRIEGERPDLAIVDFEPALPRAAARVGIPMISLDHQHFLRTYDLSTLPVRLRLHAAFMAQIVRAYCRGQRETIVSSFYFPPLRRHVGKVTQAGVMLRPNILSAEPSSRGHLVAYWRKFAGDRIIAALRESGREVRIYGLGEHPASGNLTFRAIHEDRFIEDLASCDALISTAGNQLVGEALFLGKAVFVAPEPRNFEQYINAHFLAQSGAGGWCEMEQLSAARLQAFLSRLDEYRSRIVSGRMNGLPATLAAIRQHLPANVGAASPIAAAAPIAA